MQLDRIVLCVEAENEGDAIDRAQEVLIAWEHLIKEHRIKPGEELEVGENETISARLVEYEPNASGWLGNDIEVEEISAADAA
jgi:hypothetical protein